MCRPHFPSTAQRDASNLADEGWDITQSPLVFFHSSCNSQLLLKEDCHVRVMYSTLTWQNTTNASAPTHAAITLHQLTVV